ncbi:MAG TPA: efflux RND transporter periplasmic adaptor subunit, partial [Flavitalea sp.]|nr:efflux RND transporter periplasmic adaptor subunit [Flavitalea sp.]
DSVTVFTLKKEPVTKQVNFPAELTSLERAEIFAKVSGYIKSVKADIGDRVQKGQVLAILEAPEFSSDYSQANANAQTAYSKFAGSLDTYKRILNASKVDGTIAANELEKAKSQMMADSSSLEAAKSRLTSIAQLRDYLTIRAPFSGIITQRNVDVGTLVGTNNTKPLLVLENNSSLRLRIPVPEAYTAAIPDTSYINFIVDAQPNTTFKAKLSRKAGSLNLSNRTETWEYLYLNSGNQLKSGMYANALLKLGRKENSFVVPSTAVATNLEKRFVIRLKDGQAEWVDVRNGITMNDKVEIFGNLNEGDLLLVRATDEIKQGTKPVPKR